MTSIVNKLVVAALVGPANAGKSSFINKVTGANVSIVTHKKHTTRSRIRAITSYLDTQMVFYDTPGLHIEKAGLSKFMEKETLAATEVSDVVIAFVEAKGIESKMLNKIAFVCNEKPLILLVNKIDASTPERTQETISYASEVLKPDCVALSSLVDDNYSITQALDYLRPYAVSGRVQYHEDFITDAPKEFIISEIIRKHAILNLREELPYGTCVFLDKVFEKSGNLFIQATLCVEKESQKKIAVGKAGSKVKEISSAARMEISDSFEVHAHLDLFIKVLPNWSESPEKYTSYSGRVS